MFTIEQIKQAHAIVKTGADFPNYVQLLIKLGVKSYETYVSDGHTLFRGADGFTTQSNARYDTLDIAGQADTAQFKKELKAHQQGKTDYPSFCQISAKAGVEKWIVDTAKMTCAYFDKAGNKMLVEQIPAP